MTKLEFDNCTLEYQIGDCLELMKDIPDKSIDLVLTDPPYGVDLDYGNYDDSIDNLRKMIPQFMKEVLRIGKIVALTPGYNNIYEYPKPSHILIWYNPAGVSLSSWGFNCWQPILVYGKDPYLANGLGGRSDIIFDNSSDKKDDINHPCPKPKSLWVKIIKRCSINEKDTILDPFLGSGTTLLACRKTGRNGIGFEINPDYEPIIRKRIMADTKTIWQFGGDA